MLDPHHHLLQWLLPAEHLVGHGHLPHPNPPIGPRSIGLHKMTRCFIIISQMSYVSYNIPHVASWDMFIKYGYCSYAHIERSYLGHEESVWNTSSSGRSSVHTQSQQHVASERLEAGTAGRCKQACSSMHSGIIINHAYHVHIDALATPAIALIIT